MVERSVAKYRIGAHLYPVREFPEVKVLAVVERDRVRVLFGQLAPVETFLKRREAVHCTREIEPEDDDDQGFDGAAIQRHGQVIAEPGHAAVLRIVDRIAGVVRIHSTGAQHSIKP